MLSGEGTLPLTESELRSFASSSEMERGLLETLMGNDRNDDEATLKRNKERRAPNSNLILTLKWLERIRIQQQGCS